MWFPFKKFKIWINCDVNIDNLIANYVHMTSSLARREFEYSRSTNKDSYEYCETHSSDWNEDANANANADKID